MSADELDLNKPLLAASLLDPWPCHSWTFERLSSILGEKLFRCRLAPKTCAQHMETQCVYKDITLAQFCAWLDGNPGLNNPLSTLAREHYSCYIDYKYMKDMFIDHPEVFEQVKWSVLGLGDFDGYDSTIWLASEGANTPGHQDSYGFNLVTQIYGRKLWILFPPEDSAFMYPTRIPYEESSIFTQVNIRRPDFEAHPNFKLSHPVIVTLCPGQVLYVPRHWWHYVESLEPSISVNVWVPLREDNASRLTEAVTRCLAMNLISSLDTSDDHSCMTKWLNPTESLTPVKMNLLLLKSALNGVIPDGDKGTNSGKELCECTDNAMERNQDSVDKQHQQCHVKEESQNTSENSIIANSVDRMSGEDVNDSMTCDSKKKDDWVETDTRAKEETSGCEISPIHELHHHRASTCESNEYLNSFAAKIKGHNICNAFSPFICDKNVSVARKRKTDDGDVENEKRPKLEPSDEQCEAVIVNLESSGISSAASGVTATNFPNWYALNSCTVGTYINLLDKLCKLNQCEQCHRNYMAGNADGMSISEDSSKVFRDLHSSAQSVVEATDSGRGAAAAGVTSVGTSGLMIELEDVSEKNNGRTENSQNAGKRRKTRETYDDSYDDDVAKDGDDDDDDSQSGDLSVSEVAEAVLKSVLHPDVIKKLSTVFLVECKNRMRKKIKENCTQKKS